MSYVTQSVVIKRDKMSRREADRWVKEHGYHLTQPDVTTHFYRYRQVAPERLHGFRFRTIDLGDVGHLIVAYSGPQK